MKDELIMLGFRQTKEDTFHIKDTTIIIRDDKYICVDEQTGLEWEVTIDDIEELIS